MLFLERLLFVFVLVFSLLGFLSLLNKLVGPPLSYIGLKQFGLVWKRVGKCLCGKKSSFLTVAYALSCHA